MLLRDKFNECVNDREYRIKLNNFLYPPYWDDGVRWPYIHPDKLRSYKSWKNYRDKQYKMKKIYDGL